MIDEKYDKNFYVIDINTIGIDIEEPIEIAISLYCQGKGRNFLHWFLLPVQEDADIFLMEENSSIEDLR